MEETEGGKWDVATAKACISRNGGRVISKLVSFGRAGPGIRVLGAVDYLVHYCGFSWVRG